MVHMSKVFSLTVTLSWLLSKLNQGSYDLSHCTLLLKSFNWTYILSLG